MARFLKTLDAILRGTADANIRFADVRLAGEFGLHRAHSR